jgi:hypothetical protein
MSDTDTDSSTRATATNGEDSVIDKAKQAAADIDVQALMGRAKEVAGDVKDKSVTAAVTTKDKVRELVGTNEDKIDGVIDRTSQFVDEKLTRHKFSDQISKASEAAKGAVNKVGVETAEDKATEPAATSES